MANSVDPDQPTPIGAVGSGSSLFACMHKFASNVSRRLQQTIIFSDTFFLALKGFTLTKLLLLDLGILNFTKIHTSSPSGVLLVGQ